MSITEGTGRIEETKDGQAEQEPSRGNVWRGSPRVWERCIFCDLHKKCAEAQVTRGSSACVDARYALLKGR